jgi:hypothetical protein
LRLGLGPYHGSVNINLSEHARRRLREKGLTVLPTRPQRALQDRGPAHPSAKKRTQKGRALSGEIINVVVYTEAKAGDFRIVSVITPERN